MTKVYLGDLIKLAVGDTTSDKAILKADIIRKVIYAKADEMLVAKNLLPLETISALDLQIDRPTEAYFEAAEVAEGSRGKKSMVKWFPTKTSLKKWRVEVFISDEAKARQMADIQTRVSLDMAAKGMAIKKDNEIFTALAAGAAGSGAAVAKWDAITGSDPADDIANAIETILANTTLMETEIKNINVAFPAKLWGHLTKLQEIENIHRSVMDYMKQAWGIGFYPTRQLTADALVIVKSDETAVHYTYAGRDIPMSEEERVPGAGINYLVTQYYKTLIIPTAEGGTTNYRIYKITTVA